VFGSCSGLGSGGAHRSSASTTSHSRSPSRHSASVSRCSSAARAGSPRPRSHLHPRAEGVRRVRVCASLREGRGDEAEGWFVRA